MYFSRILPSSEVSTPSSNHGAIPLNTLAKASKLANFFPSGLLDS